MTSKLDLIMHPVRMQIIVTLQGRELTPKQIADHLPDIPQASLYRHIKTLSDGGVLDVVDETPIRGTVERTYRVQTMESFLLGQKDIEHLSLDDHMRMFTIYTTTLLGAFHRYLNRHTDEAPPNFTQDVVGYRTMVFDLTDEEFLAMIQAMNAAVMPFVQKEPSEDARRRLFFTVTMPDDEPGDESR